MPAGCWVFATDTPDAVQSWDSSDPVHVFADRISHSQVNSQKHNNLLFNAFAPNIVTESTFFVDKQATVLDTHVQIHPCPQHLVCRPSGDTHLRLCDSRCSRYANHDADLHAEGNVCFQTCSPEGSDSSDETPDTLSPASEASHCLLD